MEQEAAKSRFLLFRLIAKEQHGHRLCKALLAPWALVPEA